jgi:hypothetical protein
MTLYRESDTAFGRYGSLPSAVDRTQLDEISLYGELLQAVADWDDARQADFPDGVPEDDAGRLDQELIDRALGLIPAGG